MPLYEYYCTDCKASFTKKETMQQHERHRWVKCDNCGSRKTRRLLRPAFVVTTKKS